jgi:cytochrome c oxidase assembly factor CtaG
LATLLSPVPAWLCYVAILWISHFSGLYNAALQNELVHGLEHGLYFCFALLFWSAVVQTGFVPHPVRFEARLLYVFLAIPQGAFLGLALYQTRVVLYAHYAALQPAAVALADQHNAGALMWMGGGILMFAAFVITAALWAAHEREPELRYGI